MPQWEYTRAYEGSRSHLIVPAFAVTCIGEKIRSLYENSDGQLPRSHIWLGQRLQSAIH